ncbi:RbsD/FucU family protein [Paenibacillus koleovorans]|uniref:RbsD/FucU family protein n=1 Tax=Paenibacillus koleovorans TaxID=121608 RepID=UPI000FDAFB6A|nr:RbsD/FucU domain-containing protein [Paenibacillus koleovorans]
MLRGIPSIISPDLMNTLMRMGHGDEIVFADRNFPADTCGKRVIRADGHLISHLLSAVLPYFPLDHAVPNPVAVMSLVGHDQAPPVWDTYRKLLSGQSESFIDFEYVERFAFYERASQAFAVVSTGDQAFKGNIILKKGVVRDS